LGTHKQGRDSEAEEEGAVKVGFEQAHRG
jgi:hypothetical protein